MGAQKNLQGSVSLTQKVERLQSYGFEVMAGFIVGLDTDPADIADQTIDFIQAAGIPVAMVGILGVLPDTPDHKRFGRQDRLIDNVKYTGDSGLFNRVLSFVPEIEPDELFARHRKIVETINSPGHYFERCLTLYDHKLRPTCFGTRFRAAMLMAGVRALWTQGVVASYRWEYWKFLAKVLWRYPRHFGDAIRLAVSGHHLIVTTKLALRLDDLHLYFRDALRSMRERIDGCPTAYQPSGLPAFAAKRAYASRPEVSDVRELGDLLIETAQRECDYLSEPHRDQMYNSLADFRREIGAFVKDWSSASQVTASTERAN